MTDRICGCGTCKDAMEVAIEVWEEANRNNCPNWAIQLSLGMQIVSSVAMAAVLGTDPRDECVTENLSRLVDKLMTAAHDPAIITELKTLYSELSARVQAERQEARAMMN